MMVKSKLAIDGGNSVRQAMLPISKSDLGDDEMSEIKKVINNGWVTEGPTTKRFEEKFAESIGTKHAIATNSGTSALHMLIIAMNITDGMKVAVPSFTFISSASCILFERGEPVFVEVDPFTFNMDPTHLDFILKNNDIKAVIVVDLFGHPANYNKILSIVNEYQIPIIEDSAEAHLASLDRKNCGTFGKAGIFSFYPTKNMTTGEGGMITTNDDELATVCRKIKNHGRLTVNEDHDILGYTFRMSDILAAVGLAQLKKLDRNIERRRENASILSQAFKGIDEIISPTEEENARHVYMNYVIRLDLTKLKVSRDYFVQALNAEKINSKVYFHPPVHLQPLFKEKFGYHGG